MECYTCASQATQQCRRCLRLYCDVHGSELCAECLNPASALPSFNLYRGSLLALLVGTAVAIWLLVQPPGGGSSGPSLAFGPTEIAGALGTPTPATFGGPMPEITFTPEPPTTATPTATAAAPPETYTVESGDTLLGIAIRFAPPGVDPFNYIDQIALANGFSVDDIIRPGDSLVLP